MVGCCLMGMVLSSAEVWQTCLHCNPTPLEPPTVVGLVSCREGNFKPKIRGHGGRVVTPSPPTSEARVRFPARPQVGKLVVACQFTVQNPDELYVLVSSALPTTCCDMTCTVLKVTRLDQASCIWCTPEVLQTYSVELFASRIEQTECSSWSYHPYWQTECLGMYWYWQTECHIPLKNHYGQITVYHMSVFAGTSLHIDKLSVLGCIGIDKLSVTPR